MNPEAPVRKTITGNLWGQALQRAWISGSAGSILSTLALAICGRLEGTTAAGPVNAPSQWVWGEQSAHRRRTSARETLLGYAIHHAVSIAWATAYERFLARPDKPWPNNLARAGVTASLAYLCDFWIARGRLQPGFDKQLGRLSLFAVYASFALGLTVSKKRAQSRLTRLRLHS